MQLGMDSRESKYMVTLNLSAIRYAFHIHNQSFFCLLVCLASLHFHAKLHITLLLRKQCKDNCGCACWGGGVGGAITRVCCSVFLCVGILVYLKIISVPLVLLNRNTVIG